MLTKQLHFDTTANNDRFHKNKNDNRFEVTKFEPFEVHTGLGLGAQNLFRRK